MNIPGFTADAALSGNTDLYAGLFENRSDDGLIEPQARYRPVRQCYTTQRCRNKRVCEPYQRCYTRYVRY